MPQIREVIKYWLYKRIRRSRFAKAMDPFLERIELISAKRNAAATEFEKQINSTLKEFDGSSKLGDWGLAKASLIELCALLSRSSLHEVRILELGSGLSTLFWDKLSGRITTHSVQVLSIEHDTDWYNTLLPKLQSGKTKVKWYPVKQLSCEERNLLFRNYRTPTEIWDNVGKIIIGDEIKNTRAKNMSYAIPSMELPPADTIDALIVDGPHGNGRSMAYPLFYPSIRDGGFILIDDYTHYPFLEDLRRIYNVKIVRRCKTLTKSWVIVKVFKGG